MATAEFPTMFPDVNAARNLRHGVKMRIPMADTRPDEIDVCWPARYLKVNALIDALHDVYHNVYRDYASLGFEMQFTTEHTKGGWYTVSYVVPVGSNTEQSARFERVLTITRALIAVYRVNYADLYAFNRWVDCREFTEYL